jgi:cell division septation protein DedD
MKELRDIKSRYDFTLDNRQVVLIVSGLILVLMLSFLMGALFGRNLARMADVDRETTVASAPEAVESTATKEETVRAAMDSIPETKRQAQSEESSPAVSKPDKEALLRRYESMKVPTGIEDQGEQLSDPDLAPAPPVMGRLDEGEASISSAFDQAPGTEPDEVETTEPAKPAGKKAEISGPDSTRPAAAAGSYTIQLASLPNRADADALVKELRQNKYDAFMLQVTLPGKGTFYRVRVGRYVDLNQARKALAILQKREGKYFDAWITQ